VAGAAGLVKNVERGGALGSTLLPGSPEDFGRLIAGETDKWGKLVASLGLHVE
jgi:hypothetical protein